MFEGWASEFLAASIGRFVDVQRDKLRISLWSGSGVLENVRLRAEAFDYLNLPFAIHEGVVGRLRIKIPWGNWLTGSLVVELSDVVLCATERDDSEWEEAAALRREQAAKQADLAAAELTKLSRRMVAQQHQQQQQQASTQQQRQQPGSLQQQQAHPQSNSLAGGLAAADSRGSVAGGQRDSHGGAPSTSGVIREVSTAEEPSMSAAGGTATGAASAGSLDSHATTYSGESSAAGGAACNPAAAAFSGSAGGGSGCSFGGGILSAAMQYVSQFLLNRLQFSVRNIHIAFRGRQDGVPFSVGLALDSLSTVPEPKAPKSVLARVYGAALSRHAHAKLARHIAVRGLGLYWRAPRADTAYQRDQSAATAGSLPLPHPNDYIIRPLDLMLRITVVAASGASAGLSVQYASHLQQHQYGIPGSQVPEAAAGQAMGPCTVGDGGVAAAVSRQSSAGSGIRSFGYTAGQHPQQTQGYRHSSHHQLQQQPSLPAVGAAMTHTSITMTGGVTAGGMHLEAVAGTDALRIQVRPEQLQSMAQLADDLEVWTKRNRYGRFRPPGWCTVAQMQRIRADAAAVVNFANEVAASAGGSGGEAIMSQLPQIQRSSSDPGRIQETGRLVLQSVQEEDEGPNVVGPAGRRVAQLTLDDVQGPFEGGDSGVGNDNTDRGEAYVLSPLLSLTRRAYASSVALFSADVDATTLSVPELAARGLADSADGGHCSSSGGDAGAGLREYKQQRSHGGEREAGGPAASRVSIPIRTQATRTPGPLLDREHCSSEAAASAARVVPSSPACAGASIVQWSHVWQYAVRAVLHDVRERRGTGSLRDYLQYKREYVRLYRRKLEYLRHSGGYNTSGGSTAGGCSTCSNAGAGSVTAAPIESVVASSLSAAEDFLELQRLEAYLSVTDILTFRQLTERALEEEQERDRAAAATAVAVATSGGSSSDAISAGGHPDIEPQQHRSWLAWGLSGVAGFFMYGSGGGAGGAKAAAATAVPQTPLTDAELAELYRLLQGTPLHAAVAAQAHIPGRNYHHHHQHHYQQQQHIQQGPQGQPHPQTASFTSGATIAMMPFAFQLRVLQITLDIKASYKLCNLPGHPKSSETVTGSGGIPGALSQPPPISGDSSPVSLASVATGVSGTQPPSGPTLLSLVLGSTALTLESDGSRRMLQASIGTLYVYDLCSDPGVADCILAQADDLDSEGVGNASGGVGDSEGHPVTGFSSRLSIGEPSQHSRRGPASGSWASLGQLLSGGTGGRLPGLHSSVSAESLDSDAGHWAMGYQSQTSQASQPVDVWYGGPPVVAVQQGSSGGDGLVDIHIRPLRLVYRPRCIDAVSEALTVDYLASLKHHAVHAITGFGAQDARVLALLQHLGCTAPSRKLRVQVKGFEVVVPLEEPSLPGDDSCGGLGDGSEPLTAAKGQLTVGFLDIELASIMGLPPPLMVAEVASKCGAADNHCEGLSGGSVNMARPDRCAVMKDPALRSEVTQPPWNLGARRDGLFNSVPLQRLQELMQRRLTPSSTVADLAQLAAETAGLGPSQEPSYGGSSEASSGGSAHDASADAPRPDDSMGTPCYRGSDRSRVSTLLRPCTVDHLARLFLYEHMQFSVRAVRVSYQLPSARLPTATNRRQDASMKSAPQQQQHHTALGEPFRRSMLTAARPLQLLPRGLQLNGYISRSRLEQGSKAPASLIRLSLSGISTTVKASEVADLQRLAQCLSYSQAPDAFSPKGGAYVTEHVGSAAAGALVPSQLSATSQQFEAAAPPSGSSETLTSDLAPKKGSAATTIVAAVTEVAAPAAPAAPAPAPGPVTIATEMAVKAVSILSPAANIGCPLPSPHGGSDAAITTSESGPPRVYEPEAFSHQATGASGLARSLKTPCTRSAPQSPLPCALTNPLFPAGSVSHDSDRFGSRDCSLGRRASLGSGPGGVDAAAGSWGGKRVRSPWRSSAGAASDGDFAVSRMKGPPMEHRAQDLTLLNDAAEQAQRSHTAFTTNSSLRLPPLPRTTCFLLFVEPFEVRYLLDGGAGSEWGDGCKSAAAASATIATSPGFIIRTSDRTDIFASYVNDSSISKGSTSSGAVHAAATTTVTVSLQLHGTQVDVLPPPPPPSLTGSGLGTSITGVFWSLARTICISSLTASVAGSLGGGLSACGAIRGLRLLGPSDQPGNFLLSNGAESDDAIVSLQYWSAGAEPPLDPEEAAAVARARIAAGWWQSHECRSAVQRCNVAADSFVRRSRSNGDKELLSCTNAQGMSRGEDGGLERDSASGGLELVVSDVAMGMDLLMSLAALSDTFRATNDVNNEVDGKSTDASSATVVQLQPSAAAAASITSTPAVAEAPALAVAFEVRSCAILAVSLSQTPFAAASGSSAHLACNAVVSIDELKYNLRPQLVRPFDVPSAPLKSMLSASKDVAQPTALVGGMSTAKAKAVFGAAMSSIANLNGAEERVVKEAAVTSAAVHEVAVKGLLLYLADNPDSAYLSPVLLLPEVRASYMPSLSAATLAGRSCPSFKAIGGANVDAVSELRTRVDDAAQQTSAPEVLEAGKLPTGLQLSAIALSVDLGRVEVNLQPQQVGVMCALLAELPTSSHGDEAQSREEEFGESTQWPQKHLGVRRDLGAVPEGQGKRVASTAPSLSRPAHGLAPPLASPAGDVDSDDLAALLPYVMISAKLDSLTAVLGSDTLSEEATVLYWRDARLSYGRTDIKMESSLAWRDLTCSSVSSRLYPTHDSTGSATQWLGNRGPEVASDDPAVMAEIKIHAGSLAIMHELSSCFQSAQSNAVAAAINTQAPVFSGEMLSPAASLLTPGTWPLLSSAPTAAPPRPSQMLLAPSLALAQAQGLGAVPRIGSLQQITDGGGGGDADAEFYSIEGGSSALDGLEVAAEDAEDYDHHPQMLRPEPDGTGSLRVSDAGEAAPPPGRRSGDFNSNISTHARARRGTILRTRLPSGKSITNVATLPEVPNAVTALDELHERVPREGGAGTDAHASGVFSGNIGRVAPCPQAQAAVVLFSAGAPSRWTAPNSSLGFCSAATSGTKPAAGYEHDTNLAQLATLLVQAHFFSRPDCGGLYSPPAAAKLCPSPSLIPSPHYSPSPSPSCSASSGEETPILEDMRRCVESPNGTGDGHRGSGPKAPADSITVPPPLRSPPHFDVDLSGLHILVSLTQWHRLQDSLKACERHWHTAEAGQLRARMRQQQLAALAVCQQVQQQQQRRRRQQWRQGKQQRQNSSDVATPVVFRRDFNAQSSRGVLCGPPGLVWGSQSAVTPGAAVSTPAAAVGTAAAASQHPAAAAATDVSTDTISAAGAAARQDDLLQLLLHLPTTASLSVQDVALTAYSSPELVPAGRAGRAVRRSVGEFGPAHKPAGQRLDAHARQAVGAGAAEAAVATQQEMQRCVRIELMVGASLEASGGGCLDRLTLVLPEVSASTGLLLLEHDPRVGTWHSLRDARRLALLEGLSCAAVPHIHGPKPARVDRVQGHRLQSGSFTAVQTGSRRLTTEKAAITAVAAALPFRLSGGSNDGGPPTPQHNNVTPPSPPLAHTGFPVAGSARPQGAGVPSTVLRSKLVAAAGYDSGSEPEGGVHRLARCYGSDVSVSRIADSSEASAAACAGTFSNASESVVVHALFEASLQQASFYASRYALLQVLGLMHDTLEKWEHVTTVTDRRCALEGSDSEADGAGGDGATDVDSDGNWNADDYGPALLDERALRLVGSPGIAAIAATAAGAPRGASRPQVLCGSATGHGGRGRGNGRNAIATNSTLAHDNQYDMWPHDDDNGHDMTAGPFEARFGGPELRYQYHSLPQHPSRNNMHGRPGRRRQRKPAGGIPVSKCSVDAAGLGTGSGVGHGDGLGLSLPLWLPLCCLTIRVGKAAAVVYTDMQGFDLPLFEAAIVPLEVQLKLSALGDASVTAAADSTSSSPALETAALAVAKVASADGGVQAPFALGSIPAADVDQAGMRSAASMGIAPAAPMYVRHQLNIGGVTVPSGHYRTALHTSGRPGFGMESGYMIGLQRRYTGSGRRPGGGGVTQRIGDDAVCTNAEVRSAPLFASSMHVVIDASVLLDVYNLDKLGWEPVLEPWAVQVLYMTRQPNVPRYGQLRQGLGTSTPPTPPPPNPPRQSVSITTNTLLEATISPGLIPAALAVTQLADELRRALANPKTVNVASVAVAPDAVTAAFTATGQSEWMPGSSSLGGAAFLNASRAEELGQRPQDGTARGPGRGYMQHPPGEQEVTCRLSRQPNPNALPRLWLQNNLGQPVSFLTLEKRPQASFLAAVGAAGAVDGVVTHGSLAVVDSVPRAGQRFEGRHVASMPPQDAQVLHPHPRHYHHGQHHAAREAALDGINALDMDMSHSSDRRTCANGAPSGGVRVGKGDARNGNGGGSGSRMLYFRLYGGSTWLGPILCNAAQGARYYFSLPPAAAAPQAAAARAAAAMAPATPPGLRLVCDVRPHSLCSRRLELRSNVRLRNESGLWLSMGDWAAVAGADIDDGGQVLLHTLPPSGTTWLSTGMLQHSPAVLAVRTAAPPVSDDGDVPLANAHSPDMLKGNDSSCISGEQSVVRFRDTLMKELGTTANSSLRWSHWSIPIDLTSMLFDAVSQGLDKSPAASTANRLGVARRVYCTLQSGGVPLSDTERMCHLIIHLVPVAAGYGGTGSGTASQRPEWELVVMAPVILRNDLPVPARFALQAYGGAGAIVNTSSTAPHAPELRESLPTLTSLHMHAFPAHRLASVACRPVGYAWSSAQLVYGTSGGNGEGGDGFEPLHPGLEQPLGSGCGSAGGGSSAALVPCREAALLIRPTQVGLQDLLLVLRIWRHNPTGHIRLELSCPVWIYNCTGLPVQLRPTARLVLPPGQPARIVTKGTCSDAAALRPAEPLSAGLGSGSDGSDVGGTSWVPPCMSLGGAPTLATAAGPCTSQLAALQAAAGLFMAATGRSVQAHSGHVDFAAVARDAMSSSGGCGVAISATARSSSSVRSHRSVGAHTIASSAHTLGGGSLTGGVGVGSSSGGGGGSGFGSTGLLAALTDGGGSIVGDDDGGAMGEAELQNGSSHPHRVHPASLVRIANHTSHNNGSVIVKGAAASATGTYHVLPEPTSSSAYFNKGLMKSSKPHIARQQSLDQLNPAAAVKYNRIRGPASAEHRILTGASFQGSNLSRPKHAFSPPHSGPARASTMSPPPASLPSVSAATHSRSQSPYASGGGATDAGRRSQALQPCMYGSMPVGPGQLELCVWHGSSGGWSSPIWPDVNGSPLYISLPCPLPDSEGGISPAGAAASASATGPKGAGNGGRPAFHVVVRLAHVTIPSAADFGGVRSVALHLLPRYVVHNGLSAAVQVRQQGTSHTASLGPGERRPVHWADISLPMRLQIRIQDPGWSWSGGVAVDAVGPGDLFVKIRHRNRAETQLVRVDVSLSSSGSMLLSLSHHHTDFAPYRIDNCSGEVLHVQQVGCLDQEDVIRPYACLPYTWDEHTAKQRVLVSLPGRRRLGEYELEKVGLSHSVSVVASQTGGHGRKNLLVTITADGPTRVLKVVDTAVHPIYALSSTMVTRASVASPTKGSSTPGGRGRGRGGAVSGDLAAETAGEEWQTEITAMIAGAAVSVVSERAEVLYVLAQGLHGTIFLGPAKVSASSVLQHVRWDNCLRGAVFPIVLYSPVGRSMFNTAVMLPVPAPPSAAARSGATIDTYVGPGAAALAAGGVGHDSSPGPQVRPGTNGAAYEHRAVATSAVISSDELPAGPQSRHALALQGAVPTSRLSSPDASPHDMFATSASAPAAASAGVGTVHGVSSGSSRPAGLPPAPAALAGRIVVWRNRPGGVICVQHASLTAAPLAVSVEETHLREVLRLASQFTAAAAAAAAAAVEGCGRDGDDSKSWGRSLTRATPAQSKGEPYVPYVPDLSLLRPASPSLPGSSQQGVHSGGGAGRNSTSAFPTAVSSEALPGVGGGGVSSGTLRAGRLSVISAASSTHGTAAGLAARSLVHFANAPGSIMPPGEGSSAGGHTLSRNRATSAGNLRQQLLARPPQSMDGCTNATAMTAGDGSCVDSDLGFPAPRSRRIYIEELQIGEIRISASFAPRPYSGGSADVAAVQDLDEGHVDDDRQATTVDVIGDGDGGSGSLVDSAVRLAVSLAHLEGAWVMLRPLDMRYALMRSEALVQNVCRHYMTCAMLELIKVVGSLDMFGDIVRLLQGLGLGVWHLISMPVAGALGGDMRKFAVGLASGVGSMVRSITYAASSSVVKASRRARTTLATLAPEPLNQSMAAAAAGGRSGVGVGGFTAYSGRVGGAGSTGSGAVDSGGQIVQYRDRVGGGGTRGQSPAGQRDLLLSIWEGYAAILQRVATEASRLSPGGTARELLMGGLGAMALPSMAVLQLVEVAAASMRAAVSPRHGHGHGYSYGRTGTVRPRIPRYVDPSTPLQRYCWLEAMCRLLQREVRGGAFAEEAYVGGVQISDSTFAVVTRRHLLVVSPRQLSPLPEWRAAHPSDLALSLVLPLEGLVMTSISTVITKSKRNLLRSPLRSDGGGSSGGGGGGGGVAFASQFGGREEPDDGSATGRVVCIAHLKLEDSPSRHQHYRNHQRHHQAQHHLSSHGLLRLQAPSHPPPQQPVGIAAAVRPYSHSAGGAHTGEAARGRGGATASDGNKWTGNLFRLSLEGGGSLLSLRYRQAAAAVGTGFRGHEKTNPGGGAASRGAAAVQGPLAAVASVGVPVSTAATFQGTWLMGHGMREAVVMEDENAEEDDAQAARQLPPPSPWLCVTFLDLSAEADAVRLVSLLEEVRRWYDVQRDMAGCRMIGF